MPACRPSAACLLLTLATVVSSVGRVALRQAPSEILACSTPVVSVSQVACGAETAAPRLVRAATMGATTPGEIGKPSLVWIVQTSMPAL